MLASVANCVPMPDEPPPPDGDVTDDAVLSGRLRLLQPRRGHRFGHDAVLLAAATPARDGDRVAELGAGVGAAGLALAWRVGGARVMLIDNDRNLAALAATNAERNGLAGRVDAVVLDIVADEAAFAHAGLPPASCDIVLMNPPFNDPGRHPGSPDPRRRAAHDLPLAAITPWVAAAARLLRPGSILTLIFRADGLAGLLDALQPGFGAIAVKPIYPKPGADAIRILAGAVKGSRAPLAILPGFVLADDDGASTPEAEAVLRQGAALRLAAGP
jgi:tRNA1(Val) A37 N6-methylase TrmN6